VALVESEVSGAMSSLATASTAVVSSVLASTYVPLLLRLLGG
jgi:hypothetical protein